MALKVMTVVGTRPEVIKLSRVIYELDQSTRQILVHTGQNYDYELNGIFFEELGLRKPDHFLNVDTSSLGRVLGEVLIKSCLSAIAAKRRQVPVFHLEAGNRCFDERVPEEINRRIIDHISDINLAYTEHARRYLLAEGIRPETVFKIGSPMREVLAFYRPGIDASQILESLRLAPQEYLVASVHREENIDPEVAFASILHCLNRIAVHFNMRVIVSTHPRTRKRMQESGTAGLDPRIDFAKPMGFLDYVKLQQSAFCVVSDSGTITEECSILGFPAVMIRETHERPEGVDAGALVMAGLAPDRVVESIELVTRQVRSGDFAACSVPDYAAEVVRILLSYTDFVNRRTWRK